MAEQKCTGDCLKCTFQQQVYCSAQRTYGLMKNQEAIVARLERIESILAGFAPQELIALKDPAQEGAGAENRAPETFNP